MNPETTESWSGVQAPAYEDPGATAAKDIETRSLLRRGGGGTGTAEVTKGCWRLHIGGRGGKGGGGG